MWRQVGRAGWDGKDFLNWASIPYTLHAYSEIENMPALWKGNYAKIIRLDQKEEFIGRYAMSDAKYLLRIFHFF